MLSIEPFLLTILQYEFLKTLSADSSNTVIGLARDTAATQAKVDADKLKNVHVLQGDLTSAASLNAAAKQVADITGKSVDYLIINGAYLSPETMFMKSSDFVGKEEFFLNEFTMSMNTNVVGTLFAVNAFISLVKNSAIKKIIVITSGHASTEAMEIAGVDNTIPYAISKVAVNALVTKMAIEYRDEGVVFLALSPGVVNTAEDANNSEWSVPSRFFLK